MDSLGTCPVAHCISRNVESPLIGLNLPIIALCDLRVRFHLNRYHPTVVPVLACFLNHPFGSRSGQEHEGMIQQPIASPRNYCVVKQDCFSASVNSSQQLLEICLVDVQVFHCSAHSPRWDISNSARLAPCASVKQQAQGPERFHVLRLDQEILC